MTTPSHHRGAGPADHLAVAGRRLHVFVPALMSVGFAFWLGALMRDAFRRHGDTKLARRARVAGPAVAELTRTGSTPRAPTGLRRRRTYVLWSIPFLALGTYAAFVATRNYTTPSSGVSEIGWLLALSLSVAISVAVVGAVLLVIGVLGRRQTPGTMQLAANTPLGTTPDRPPPGTGPGRALPTAIVATIAAVVALALTVDFANWLDSFDDRVADAVDVEWLGWLEAVDPLGSSLLTVVAAALLGLASFRCRPLLLAYPTVVVGGFLVNVLGGELVERERPPAGVSIADADSFPSGHLIQLTLILGLLPMTLQVLTRRTLRFRVVTTLSVVIVVLSAVHRVRVGAHWPTDVIAGILVGLALVLFAHWMVAHETWHRWCHHCPWHEEEPPDPILRGAVPVAFGTANIARLSAHLSAFAVTGLLAYLGMTRGLPVDSDGVFLDEEVQRSSQLGLAGLVSLGAVVAWKWDAVGAVMLAVAATGLGVFAAVQYSPVTAFALTFVVLVPAVLLWLSWQHRRTAGEIVALALVTLSLMAVSWVAIREVHASILGPTHPASAAVLVPVDEVEWVWSGGVGTDRATVVARVGGGHETARLRVVAEDGAPITVEDLSVEHELARFEIEGLTPDTRYRYTVEVDGELDTGRGSGSFRTPGEGPTSFTFVAGSCSRSGTNAAVFDSIAAEDPLFFLQLGDLFYDNISRADRDPFDAAFDRHLTAPGPAELYRDVPIAYVWDDHDYGPNDSDASSPTRDVAREVFRSLVPSHELAQAEGGPIHRAFTIGRVHFVVSDTRSARTDTTMLGESQLGWLLDELVAAAETHALVVWANPTPWVGEPSDASDLWNGRAAERQVIADEIARAGIDNLLMVSGDAHMLAFDDGTNTGYQQGGGDGFPLVHAAALDRPGNVKGGPYSGGTFPGGGQYARFDIHDDGESVVVEIAGTTWDGEVLIEERLEFAP